MKKSAFSLRRRPKKRFELGSRIRITLPAKSRAKMKATKRETPKKALEAEREVNKARQCNCREGASEGWRGKEGRGGQKPETETREAPTEETTEA